MPSCRSIGARGLMGLATGALLVAAVHAVAMEPAQPPATADPPIARETVELLRGQIWADSAVGRGTTFTVRLPAAGVDGARRG